LIYTQAFDIANIEFFIAFYLFINFIRIPIMIITTTHEKYNLIKYRSIFEVFFTLAALLLLIPYFGFIGAYLGMTLGLILVLIIEP